MPRNFLFNVDIGLIELVNVAVVVGGKAFVAEEDFRFNPVVLSMIFDMNVSIVVQVKKKKAKQILKKEKEIEFDARCKKKHRNCEKNELLVVFLVLRDAQEEEEETI